MRPLPSHSSYPSLEGRGRGLGCLNTRGSITLPLETPSAPNNPRPISNSHISRNTPDRRLRRNFTISTINQLTNHHIKHGGQKHSKERHPDHPEENHGAKRLSNFSAGAGSDDQRNHPEDKREARHQDRPKPQPRRLDGGDRRLH